VRNRWRPEIEFRQTRRRALLNRPGENQDIDAFGATAQQRARRRIDRSARGHDIVDKDNRAAFDPCSHPVGHAKRPLHIESPLRTRKPDLGRVALTRARAKGSTGTPHWAEIACAKELA
jgi:hypothetical protein